MQAVTHMCRVIAAGVAIALLSSASAFATEFRCGDKFVTFHTTGTAKTGPSHLVTVQKRMILIIAASKQGGMAVMIGRDGVPNTGTNHISPDTYSRLIRCLD